MTVRVGLIKGNANNSDTDTSAILQAVIGNAGVVISGMTYAGTTVAKGNAIVPCIRTGEFLPVLFHFVLETDTDLGTFNNGEKIYLQIDQTKIDDGSLQNSNGRNIGTIVKGTTVPSTNTLLLYSKTGGVVTTEFTPTRNTLFLYNLIKAMSIKDMVDVSEEVPTIYKPYLKWNALGYYEPWVVDMSDVMGIYAGDGSDGDVTIASNTTLARDMYYNNLTVNSGITLNTGGFTIYVKNTLTNNGTIARDGNAGGAGSTGGAGTGWAALSSTIGTCYGGGNGAPQASGSVGVANANPAPTNAIDTFVTWNWPKGGNGGMGWSGTAGATAVGATNTIGAFCFEKYAKWIYLSITGKKTPISLNGMCGSGWGAGGANGSQGTVSGGWGWGGNGGNIAIVAKTLINNATGVIRALGGAGGSAGTGSATTIFANNVGGSGWGAGGSGGIVFLLTETLTNSGSIQSTGGNGGNGGNAHITSGTTPANGGSGWEWGRGGHIFYHAYTLTLGTTAVTGGTWGTGGTGVGSGGATGATGANGANGTVNNLR